MPVAAMVKAVLKALFGSDSTRHADKVSSKLRPHHKNVPHVMAIPHYRRIVVDGKEYLVKEILSVNDNEITVLGLDNVVRVIKRRKNKHPF